MRSFAENEDILQNFAEVALKQPCLPKGTHVDCITGNIQWESD